MNSATKWILVAIAAIFVVNAIGLAYLTFGDLGRHKGIIEEILADATGYDVRIDGELIVDAGRKSTLTANDIEISSPEDSTESLYLRANHVSITLDTWSVNESTVNIESFRFKDLAFRTNGHDLNIVGEAAGAFSITHSGERGINFKLRSQSLELQREDENEAMSESHSERLFSDEKFDLSALRDFDVTLDISIGEFVSGDNSLDNLVIKATLADGQLKVSPLSFGLNEGAVALNATVLPIDDVIDLDLSIAVVDMRVGTVWSEDAGYESLPGTSGTLELNGRGSSPQQIMTSAVGELKFSQGAGRLKEIAASGLFGDVIVQVFQTLNPLSSDKPYTSLECGFYEVAIADGLADVTDLRVQTDDMMIIGDGKVTLLDESLDLSVRAKPREGLGISLGGVANSFVKLGGTLSNPELQLDAAGTATTTGAAMATGGLSLLARGLWDRLSAANDICVAADDESISNDGAPDEE